MAWFNQITSALFGLVAAPFGHQAAWLDLILWPTLMGIIALVVYKYASNQQGIERAKEAIKAHLLEIRIYREDPLTVLSATGRILVHNLRYFAFNLVPMTVLMVPMVVVLVQLEANYAFGPIEPGTVGLFSVQLDPEVEGISPTDVRLDLPEGVHLDAPPVRTADGEVVWRLRTQDPGDHILRVQVGDYTEDKGLWVGGEMRKVPVLRSKGWLALLYPGEPALGSDSPLTSMTFRYPERELGWLPGGELGIVLWFLGISLISGYALKGVFGVQL